jgi:hypothetical protein
MDVERNSREMLKVGRFSRGKIACASISAGKEMLEGEARRMQQYEVLARTCAHAIASFSRISYGPRVNAHYVFGFVFLFNPCRGKVD